MFKKNFLLCCVIYLLSGIVIADDRSLYRCDIDPASERESRGWLEKAFIVAVYEDGKAIEFFSRRLSKEDGLVVFSFPGKISKGMFGGYSKRFKSWGSTRELLMRSSFTNDFTRFNVTINFGSSDGYYPYEAFGSCSDYSGPDPEVLLTRLNQSRSEGNDTNNSRETDNRNNSNKSNPSGGEYRLTTKDVTRSGNLNCVYVNDAGQKLTYENVSSCADSIER